MAAGNYTEIQIDHATLNCLDIIGAGIGQTVIESDGLRADVDPVSGLAYSAMAEADKYGIWGGYQLNISSLTWSVNDVKYCNHASNWATTDLASVLTACRFIHTGGYPIGSGLAKAGLTLSLVSCELVKSGANAALGGVGSHGIYWHNGNAVVGSVALSLSNCSFENCGTVKLLELDSGQTDVVTVTNCATDDAGTDKGIYIGAYGPGLSYSIEITQNAGTMPMFGYDAVTRPNAEDHYTLIP